MVRAPFLKRCDPETIHTSTIFRGMFAFENDRLWRLYVVVNVVTHPHPLGKISESVWHDLFVPPNLFFWCSQMSRYRHVDMQHVNMPQRLQRRRTRPGRGKSRPRRPGPLAAAGRGRGTHLACCRLPVADVEQILARVAARCRGV